MMKRPGRLSHHGQRPTGFGVRSVAVAVLFGAALGCETVSYKSNLPPNGPTHEEHADFFFCGLAGEKTVDLEALCPQGVSRWRNQASVPDVLLSIITFAIYTPRTIYVDCYRGVSWEITTDPTSGKLASVRRVPAPRAEGDTL